MAKHTNAAEPKHETLRKDNLPQAEVVKDAKHDGGKEQHAALKLRQDSQDGHE
jgi:hypothetical protein